MNMATHKWSDIRKERFSPEHIAQIDEKIDQEIIELNLKNLREVLGKTQEEIAQTANMTQSQLSKTEKSREHLVSTLRRCVEAMGGELEIVAKFKGRTVKLTGV